MGDTKKGLGFIRKAMGLARKSMAKKHQAIAHLVKSRLLSQRRPGLIQESLEKDLALSLEMGTSLLTQKIRYAYNAPGAFVMVAKKIPEPEA